MSIRRFRSGMKTPLKPQGNFKKTFSMVAIAASMMIFIDLFFLGGWQMIFAPKPQDKPVFVPVEEFYNLPDEVFEDYSEGDDATSREAVDKSVDKNGKALVAAPLNWHQSAVDYHSDGAKAKVVIVIDDLGENYKRSDAVVDLPAPLTLAYLPTAGRLDVQTKGARQAGHELLIHAPMEPMGRKDHLGDLALLDGMSDSDVDAYLDTIFASFDGYIGINNHMGSRATQNPDLMRRVMKALHKRGLVFLDSKTVSSSVAAQIAAEQGLYHATRDIFLDHEATDDFVAKALKKTEDHALRHGYAIAIGHPKAATIKGLKAWIPTLADKGLELAPLSAVLNAPPQAEQR